MFGSQMLEVALGVICLFIFMSTIASVVREGLESWMKTRAAFLERGIQELLHDKTTSGLVTQLYNHPHVNCLYFGDYTPVAFRARPHSFSSGRALPSYIPTKNFALALMDMAARGPAPAPTDFDAGTTRITPESIRQNIAGLNNPAVQRVLLTALDAAQGDLNQVQAYLENWFDSSMDRVSGWYRRSSQWALFWIGLVLAVLLNANPITVASYLAHNDVARAAVTARAEAAVKNPRPATLNYADYYAARSELDSLGVPLGWGNGRGMALGPARHPGHFDAWNQLLGPLVGWLLMAIAITLGAPFWFDVLNKVMVIRSTVKPHEKSREEASADRQPAGSGQPGAGTTAPVAPAPPAPGPGAGAPPAAPGSDAAAGPPAAPPAVDHDLDGCDVVATTLTHDEHLPMAEGGVA